MKIRAGFVSNSSSTSFLIITTEDLNRSDFFDLMGIAQDSPIADLFEQFYQDVVSSVSTRVDFSVVDKRQPVEYWFTGKRGNGLSSHMMNKLQDAKQRGLKAYFGTLSSEETPIQSFFCTDSFEVGNEKIYFNGLECVW